MKREHNPLPRLQSYFAEVVDFSSPRFELICVIPPNEKQMALKQRHFFPHLIHCSVRDLYFNKVILRGVITASFSTRWDQRNLESEYPEIRFVNNSRSGGGGALFCQAVFVNDAAISGLQPSFLTQQHKGKRMLC